MHSTIKNENTWAIDFNGQVFFYHGTISPCGVLIGYLGKTSFVFNKQKIDKVGEILIVGVTLDTEQYILINLYNANTKTEQLRSFNAC